MLAGSRVEVLGGPNRAPLDAASSAALYELAVRVATGLGIEPPGRAAVGGASDGNFTAGVGTATLDGLGAVGGGAHADDEHVLVDRLADRTALLAALIEHVQRSERSGSTNRVHSSGASRP